VGCRLQAFRNLDVWHKAHQFTLHVYRVTEGFPKIEAFGLAATLRRGSAQIAMKIAEGCGREDSGEFIRCLQQARGLGIEVEYQLLLARDLQFVNPDDYDALQDQLIEVRKMLSGFMKTLQRQPV
jgi:four helix bundle protein